MPNRSGGTRGEIEGLIRSAFEGVILGSGISLRQAEAIDQHAWDWDYSDAEFDALKGNETVDDWSRLPPEELERDHVAHLDAEGIRYYLPALMLTVMEHYDPMSKRDIGTLNALDGRDSYNQERYALLNDEQQRAIARFVEVLPHLVTLDEEDLATVHRSYRDYWRQFLP